jgi:23S rRNA (cytidine1920-2'-O)/16S rRNA (cytidine1409-2'-O)-methyltransferase
VTREGRSLAQEVAELVPEADTEALIAAGEVLVDGVPVTNPRSRLRAGAHVTVRPATALRGSPKLRAALAAFDIDVAGRVALDVGAAAGGFTAVLLEGGARLVYAVDAGHGQLLGSLRQDPRVINLESVNIADLDGERVPDSIEVVTIDVSYLSVAAAAAQLDRVALAADATLVALVKPMFELRAATAPSDRASLDAALAAACAGVVAAGWEVRGSIDSPVSGSRGAREMLLHARRVSGVAAPRA